jgi:hypothetical protein
MTKKPAPVAITIPRSFAALAKASSTNKEAPTWMRTVLLEALPLGRVRGTGMDGFGLLRMESDVPEIQADLFGGMLDSAPAGTKAAPAADDLSTVVKAVRVSKEGQPPPVEIVCGAETLIRCGSESRRVQIEGDTALNGWPDTIDGFIPTGPVVCAQVYSTERLRDLLTAILAADALTVKVELRGGLNALRLEASGGNGEDVVGVLMPIRSPGEVGEAPGKSEGLAADGVTVTCSMEGRDPVTLTGKQFDKACREAGKPKGRSKR